MPTSPPKTTAEWGLSNLINLAISGVIIVVRIVFTTPVATLIAITFELTPKAEPVTGPTIYVQAPAPIVVRLSASEYPIFNAITTPKKNDIVTPINNDITPANPACLILLRSAPIAVATTEKSLNIEPPKIANPENSGISANPFSPPKKAKLRPNKIAIATSGIRLFIIFFEKSLANSIILPTNKKANINPFLPII